MHLSGSRILKDGSHLKKKSIVSVAKITTVRTASQVLCRLLLPVLVKVSPTDHISVNVPLGVKDKVDLGHKI